MPDRPTELPPGVIGAGISGGTPASPTSKGYSQDDEPIKELRFGLFWRFVDQIEQQEHPSFRGYVQVYSPSNQLIMSFGCSVLFAVLAVALFVGSFTSEYVVRYGAGDTSKMMVIDEDISGEALMWYELPDLDANRKRYVESLDKTVMGGFFTTFNCEGAEKVSDALWRRPGDRLFHDLVLGTGHTDGQLRPCGLVSLSTFLDSFELVPVATGEPVALDQQACGWKTDNEIFDKSITPMGNGTYSIAGGGLTWLRSGAPNHVLEHWKVWQRTPASPHVRHLWAVIPGGLPKGEYRLNIIENSPVWTGRWGVSEKRVIVAAPPTLGSPGACLVLGVICVVICVAEVIAAAIFLLGRANLLPSS